MSGGAAVCPEGEWVDPDTPASACLGQVAHDGEPLELVFSDEFNVPGRTFKDGHDPVWTALANFPSTQSQINAYDDSADFASTKHGRLRLKVDNRPSRQHYVNMQGKWVDVQRPYTSAMLQSWNKFCFTEGAVEISAKLPGDESQPGLWPAFWLMGNLGRATVQDSTDFQWPYSYSQCPVPEEAKANQEPRRQQAINQCLGQNWTKRFGLNPMQGRGAVEIDVLEGMPGSSAADYYRDKVAKGYCDPLTEEEYELLRVEQPLLLTSFILAPGLSRLADQRPNSLDKGDPATCLPKNWTQQWYEAMRPGSRNYGTHFGSTLNPNFGAFIKKDRPDGRSVRFQTDELSAASQLPKGPKGAFAAQHKYRLEWKAGDEGYLRFYLDDKFLYAIDAETIAREVNMTQNGESLGTLLGRRLPMEPMYMILNIDLSTVWNWDNTGCADRKCNCCTDCSDMNCWFCLVNGKNERDWLRRLCTTLPTTYEIDYIRVYQPVNATNTGCSPASTPTEGWIEEHRPQYFAPYSYEPLEPVYAGGGACASSAGCGADGLEAGTCDGGRCRCLGNWTGPHCRARRAGAAAVCEPLERAVIGGARCEINATTMTCGPHGECIPVNEKWDNPNQTLVLPDGTEQLVGPGRGRCRCEDGWGGPHCGSRRDHISIWEGASSIWRRRPHQGGKSDSAACVPHEFQRGDELEALIEAICGQRMHRPEFIGSVLEVCTDVSWAPAWEPDSGRYSRCGAWSRASALVAAVHTDTGLCCRGLSDGELDCQENEMGFILLISFGFAVLCIMACVGSVVQARLRGDLCVTKSARGVTGGRWRGWLFAAKQHDELTDASSGEDSSGDEDGEASAE